MKGSLNNNKIKFFWDKDPLFQSFWINKFISGLMKNGKKSLIETKILNIITFINFKLKKQFFFLFFECIEIIKPIMGIL